MCDGRTVIGCGQTVLNKKEGDDQVGCGEYFGCFFLTLWLFFLLKN